MSTELQTLNNRSVLRTSRSQNLSEQVASLMIWGAALVVSAVFLWFVADIFLHGLPLISFDFLTQEPLRAGRRGGIGPIILSTLLILGVCMAVALPLGLATAAFLSERATSSSSSLNGIRHSLEILAGIPSIVFGLFGNAFFCIYLGMGFSILSGGLTLACMVLPLLIRSAEEGFRSVPLQYRSAAAALALSRTRTLFQIVLPAALPGIAVGVVLSVGRALAETAALIFTSGYVDRTPSSLLDSGRALSIHIYDLSMNVPGGNNNAYASALVLVIILFVINFITEQLSLYWKRSTAGRNALS